MLDPNWDRWIFASVSSQFAAVARAGGVDMFVEGTDMFGRRQDKDYFEFRLDGPNTDEVSRDYWRLDFDVNILVASIKDQKDIHRIYRNVGLAATMFLRALNIYKLGNGIADNPSIVLGCAELTPEGIFVTHHGQLDPTVPVLQATLLASYKLNLDTTPSLDVT